MRSPTAIGIRNRLAFARAARIHAFARVEILLLESEIA